MTIQLRSVADHFIVLIHNYALILEHKIFLGQTISRPNFLLQKNIYVELKNIPERGRQWNDLGTNLRHG
jgi:hypothetical protein